MLRRNLQQRVLVLCFAALAGGCVSSDMSDLEAYTEEVMARPGGRIEPLPEIKPYEAYTYQSGAEGKVDPFELFYQQRQTKAEEVSDTGLSKELEMEIKVRNREELEQFELDSLKMVGTMDDEQQLWGIIVDPDGIVHRVTVGNYAGRNIGKIVNIFEDRIELREIVKNSQGRWEERQAAIALVEQQ
jgi:type IV pilus assembly protein PilP